MGQLIHNDLLYVGCPIFCQTRIEIGTSVKVSAFCVFVEAAGNCQDVNVAAILKFAFFGHFLTDLDA